jgi:hypothetical protein
MESQVALEGTLLFITGGIVTAFLYTVADIIKEAEKHYRRNK